MRLKMLETRRASEDAFTVKCFEGGKIYDNVADSTARYMICQGWATEEITAADELFNAFGEADLNKQLEAIKGIV